MAGKIGSDSRDDGVSYQDAAKGIKDAIRYTSVSEGIDFVKNYNKTKKLLEQKGYSEKRLKNFFQRYSDGKAMHKAIQCTYVDKNGYEFEIQFQTPESQAAKELKVPIYEERRKQDISPDRARYLEQQMIRLAENVPTPRNVFKIKEH